MQIDLSWLFSTRSAEICSVIGLLIAVPGFAITIFTLRRTKRAAEAARAAAVKAADDLSRSDVISQLTSAIDVLDIIRSMHHHQEWLLVLDRYSSLRRCLVSIKTSRAIANEKRAILQATISNIRLLEKKVYRFMKNGQQSNDLVRVNEILGTDAEHLHELLSEIKATIGGSDGI